MKYKGNELRKVVFAKQNENEARISFYIHFYLIQPSFCAYNDNFVIEIFVIFNPIPDMLLL